MFHVTVDSGNVLMDANFVAKVRVGHAHLHNAILTSRPRCTLHSLNPFHSQLSNVGVVSDDLKRATTESFQGFRFANFQAQSTENALVSMISPQI